MAGFKVTTEVGVHSLVFQETVPQITCYAPAAWTSSPAMTIGERARLVIPVHCLFSVKNCRLVRLH